MTWDDTARHPDPPYWYRAVYRRLTGWNWTNLVTQVDGDQRTWLNPAQQPIRTLLADWARNRIFRRYLRHLGRTVSQIIGQKG